MPLRYATADQLADYSPGLEPPANVDGLLRAASRLVTYAIRHARYVTVPSGLPEQTELVDALRDATCEQVTAWSLAGVDPTVGAITEASEGGDVKSSTVTAGPRTVTEQYTDASAASTQLVPSTTELCPTAWLILQDAGLTSSRIYAVRGYP